MGAVVVVGTHWGDEAKGKFVDIIGQYADAVVRYNGGPNAGHTVLVGDETYKLHLVPCGILNSRALAIIADGVAIDAQILIKEIEMLKKRGISVDNLRISHNAHIILPYHQRLDLLQERERGDFALGTTGRGVGPCYADKASRTGIRVGDLMEEMRLQNRLGQILPAKNRLLTQVYGDKAFDLHELVTMLLPLADALRPHVTDTSSVVAKLKREGKKLLFEGAQATLLDLDSGTYPYVTSSHPVAGGACLGTGIGPTAIDQVLGVVKGYTTRVGAGTFPTELLDERGDRIRERGHEYGTTTGRPRRCGWLDGFALRYSVAMNGITGLCIGHLDVLAGFEMVGLCVGYRKKGAELSDFPAGDVLNLDDCEPIIEYLAGWPDMNITETRCFADLPTNAQKYVRRVEAIAEVPVRFVSVGPRRHQTFLPIGSPDIEDLFYLPRP